MSKYEKITVRLMHGLAEDHEKRRQDGTGTGHEKSCSTKAQYREEIKRFARWAIEQEGRERIAHDRYHELIQRYVDGMTGRLSAYTIHKRLSALCAATHERLADYRHPRRERPVKGRERAPERHHTREEDRERVTEVARHIGIRRAELCALQGRDLIERDGRLLVHVHHGKGGKTHDQLILPAHEAAVKALFEGVGERERVLTGEEAKASIEAATHAQRRLVAREAYAWYLERPEAEKEAIWRPLMRDRLEEKHLRRADRDRIDEKEARHRGREDWQREWAMIQKNPIRRCRGDNARELERQGREPAFDREAVLFTSIMTLSHYREDVTVTNYLI